MDETLLLLLKDIKYFSRFKTCICIRLADYAAQMLGYRSTRHLDEASSDLVEELYQDLLYRLLEASYEYISLIESRTSNYKQEILNLSIEEIELELEDILIKRVTDGVDNFASSFLE